MKALGFPQERLVNGISWCIKSDHLFRARLALYPEYAKFQPSVPTFRFSRWLEGLGVGVGVGWSSLNLEPTPSLTRQVSPPRFPPGA